MIAPDAGTQAGSHDAMSMPYCSGPEHSALQRLHDDEALRCAQSLGIGRCIPRCLIRWTLGLLHFRLQQKIVQSLCRRLDSAAQLRGAVREAREYASIDQSRSASTICLLPDSDKPTAIPSIEVIRRQFASESCSSWPVLAVVVNSDLVSPFVFQDGLMAARSVIPILIPKLATETIVVLGVYESERHFAANALRTISRCGSILSAPESLDNISPSAVCVAKHLLSLMSVQTSHGEDGIEKSTSHVLRADASAILSRVVLFGYSSAFLALADSLRILEAKTRNAQLNMVGRDGVVRPLTAEEVQGLLRTVRRVGVAGVQSGGPSNLDHRLRLVNFVSTGDFSSALHGPSYLRSPGVLLLETPDVAWLRRKLTRFVGEPPLENLHGGHALMAYVKAILHPANQGEIERARQILST